MTEEKHIILPITGMHCANCVAAVERNVKKEAGVQSAVVNLSSEKATIVLDTSLTPLASVIGRVERAGFGVASGESEFWVKRMSDDNDARQLEKRLRNLEGVLSASVLFTTQKALVVYIPTIISGNEIRQEIRTAGFEAVQSGDTDTDIEAKAREAEIKHQRRLLITGLIFTLPLFILSMGRDFGLWGA